MENKKLKVKLMKEKEMTKPEIKKAHKIGKAVEKAGSAKKPFAVGMAAVQKGKKQEMEETNGAKPDFLDLENKEEPMKKAAEDAKAMKKEAAGEPEELDFEKMPASHQKAGMTAFGHDEEEMGSEPEAGEEEVEISPLDSAQSLARQIKMALTAGDTSKARELTKELIMFLQKNPTVKMQTKAGSDVDLSKVKNEAGAGFGEGPEGKEKLSESKEISVKQTTGSPYPELFEKKERFMKDRFETHEETIYQELMKRFIQK